MYVCIVDVSDGLHPWVVLAGASASCSSSPFALALALGGHRDHSWVSRASSSSISVACGRITIHTYQVNACMIHNVFKFLWIAWAQTGHQPVEVHVGDVRTVRVELVEDGVELVGVLINTWLCVCVCISLWGACERWCDMFHYTNSSSSAFLDIESFKLLLRVVSVVFSQSPWSMYNVTAAFFSCGTWWYMLCYGCLQLVKTNVSGAMSPWIIVLLSYLGATSVTPPLSIKASISSSVYFSCNCL